MTLSRRRLIGLAVVLAMWSATGAMADGKRRRRGGRRRDHDDEHDHVSAVKARKSGDILPLRDILNKLGKTHKGDIVGIEFEKKDGVWAYEIKMITPDGRYLEIYVDAKKNQIIKVEGK